jgi:PPM family protein phosphatase
VNSTNSGASAKRCGTPGRRASERPKPRNETRPTSRIHFVTIAVRLRLSLTYAPSSRVYEWSRSESGAGRGTRQLSLVTPISDLLGEVRTRTVQTHLGGAIALGTDIGLNRKENEDRVVALQTFHPDLGTPTLVAAVADGMGGMLDGGTCAEITVAAFVQEFVTPQSGSLALRLTKSAQKANQAVFARYGERGGSTLSAVAINANGVMVGINVGDSRIYASTASGFIQLTTDDTLSAAFGGQGNSLIQFIGTGDGMRSHLIDVPSSAHMLFVSSDGAHYPDAQTFGDLMARSPDPKAATERALALARWLGSPDNASIIAIDVAQVRTSLASSSSRLFATLGLTGSVQIVSDLPPSPPVVSSDDGPSSKTNSNLPKKRARSKKKKAEKADGQLQIEITPLTTDKREDSE